MILSVIRLHSLIYNFHLLLFEDGLPQKKDIFINKTTSTECYQGVIDDGNITQHATHTDDVSAVQLMILVRYMEMVSNYAKILLNKKIIVYHVYCHL